MPRLFVPNLDFEEELGARGAYTPSRESLRRNQAMAWVFLPLLREGDAILGSATFGPALIASLEALGVAPPRLLATAKSWCDLIVPWGVSPSLAGRGLPAVAAVRECHSKAFAQELAEELGLALPDSGVFSEVSAVERALARSYGEQRPWVLKRALGVAGRGALRGRGGRLDQAQRNWLERSLGRGVVVLQPWLERALDFSVVARLEASGRWELLGLTEMLVRGGTYFGTRFGAWKQGVEWPSPGWDEALERLTGRVAGRLHERAYFGPFGIDGMVSGAGDFVPLLEVNARHTMGLVALAMSRWFPGAGLGSLVRRPAGGHDALRLTGDISLVLADDRETLMEREGMRK